MKNTKRIKKIILVRLLTICFAMTFAMLYPTDKVYAADSDTITIVAGDGTYGFSGDGGPATSAQLKNPKRIALDKSGNIYITDSNNNRVRKVDTAGNINTFAGNGIMVIKNGCLATETGLYYPTGVAIDMAGNVYIAQQGFNTANKVDINEIINKIAGGNGSGYLGDEDLATFSKISGPEGITVDNEGNIYIADSQNHRIRKIDSKTGIITTIAGIGTSGYSGDGGPATSAQLNYPSEIALDSNGNMYIADFKNQRIRKIDKITGIISTVAGTGSNGYSVDGQPAIIAPLNYPRGVAIDGTGNIYIADTDNNRIRKVDTTGIISTVADKSSAGLLSPTDVKVDSEGDLYIVDSYHNQIKKLTFGRKISGNAGVAGATLCYNNGSEKTVTADTSGSYSFTVPYNWIGTVTVSKEGYTFAPNNTMYSHVLVDQTSQNYTASAVSYTMSVDGTVGGIITANQSSAVIGNTINLTITPEAGKQIKAGSLKYNDGTKDVAISGQSFTMPAANVIVKAEFEDIPAATYAVNVGSVTGGSITVNTTTAVSGSVINLTLTPEAGKQLKAGSLKYNDGTKDVGIIGTSFTMPDADVVVTAEFETASLPVTDKTLISIVSPSAITGVLNGTVKTAEALGLPSTVTIVTSGGNLSAGVTWDVNSCTYNPSSTSAQTFLVNGNVVLPTGVINTNNVSLSCTISVSVNNGSGSGGNSGSGGTGSGSTGSVSTDVPAVNLPRIQGKATAGWNSISEYIDTVNAGSIIVDMNGSTIVKKEVLESIRGKNVNVTFNLEDGLEWIVNGIDISGDTEEVVLKDIDFALSLNNDNVPRQLLENMPEMDRLQLSLDYSGNFGFTAILKLPMGKNNSGRIANLFYYNPVTNKLELQSVGQIQEDGKVELQFSHASDYVIEMNENAMLDQAMEGFTVTKPKNTIYISGTKGKSLTLNVVTPEVVKKAVTDELCSMSITHKSSKPKIASVSALGKIIAKKAGKTIITTTITINGVKKNIRNTIIVKKANKIVK